MKNIVILYHADCSDGAGAAWAAWKKFGASATYIPVVNQAPSPPGLKNKEIYLVDYCFPKAITKKLIAMNKRVTAIDHHISNKEAVSLTHKPLYALHHSGSVLAWEYFHPGKTMPHYLRYVEDIDLWKLKMPHAKAFVVSRPLLPNNLKILDSFIKRFEKANFRKKFFADGKLLLKYQKALIYEILRNKELVIFRGKRALAVNSPVFTDELASIIYAKEPVAIIWHQKKNSKKISLRSDGSVDVSKLAEHFGGGGHRRASAFKIKAGAKLPWKRLN
ncbi:MAG: hypothetical protein HYT12_02670 [Candidatus Liptonbacteria bacterium]|nr:hypothetical protein [Candidatus Liptonbacteria bacterium]